MRTLVRAFVIALMTVALAAAPAGAVHKGRVCKTFSGPDGAGGAELSVCLVVDDHDFEDQIRAMAVFSNPGTKTAEIHVSYLKLIRGSTDVRVTSSFVEALPRQEQFALATLWLNNPDGTFHSRLRMWVCWPQFAGDPCGGVVVWNSGNVTY